MKLNFRKIVSVLTSVAMLGSTVGIAAAANYPAPFISGGVADVAVVVGASAASSDYLAAIDLGQNLQVALASQTATSGTTSAGSVSGEAAPLFSGGTKLYINDTLNAVKSVVTKSELATVLKDGSFSGNVDATYVQTISIGGSPIIKFDKQPTSSNDPATMLVLQTTTANYNYNASVTFNKAVNFTHADSKGETLTLFGTPFTIASSTDSTNLVLFKSATKVSLTSDSPTTEITVGGKTYTVELVSSSDTAATVKVTDSTGASETKEISENASKKVQGVTIAVTTADETNLKLSATLIVGAEKYTLTDGSSVTYGEDATVIDGTVVGLTKTTGVGDITKITVSVAAKNSDNDAILPGNPFVDPVYGSFKLDFSGVNIGDSGNSTARESIIARNNGDDKMEVQLTDYTGNTKTIQYAVNLTNKMELQVDSDGRNITVAEGGQSYRNEYILVGNQDEGHLLRVSTITNQTGTSFSQDAVKFTDAFSGDTYTTTITSKGAGTATIGGKVYTVTYAGASTVSEDARSVRLNYPDSSSANEVILYPTIQTSKGAKFAFYEPAVITLDNFDGAGNDATSIKFPDGDGYTAQALTLRGMDNMSVGTTCVNVTAVAACVGGLNVTIGELTYDFTASAVNESTIYLIDKSDGSIIKHPALIVFEEKDDNTKYEALIITTETGRTSDDGIGVNDVVRTWLSAVTTGTTNFRHTLASDSKKTQAMDLWGSLVTLDDTDSDQRKVTISYPDEQIYAQLYIAAESATITPGTTTSGTVKSLGSITVKDNEVSKVSSKNLIVLGGSCVNTVAAKILGSDTPLCGAAFTEKAGVGADQFLVKVVESPYATTKVAMLVAGYEAADTTKAVEYLTKEVVPSDKGTDLKKVTATFASVA